MTIRTTDVRGIIIRRFGERTEAASGLTDALCRQLGSLRPGHTSFGDLQEKLQDILYAGLHAALGDAMMYTDGIRWFRVTTKDLSDTADELMGLVFRELSETAEHFDMIRSWAFQNGSLSALQCLSERYAAWQTPQEQAMMRSIWQERNENERKSRFIQ